MSDVSDPEKYEAQGRAHAALKTARSNVATLTLALHEYTQALRRLAKTMDTFVHDPLTTVPRPLGELADIQEHLRQLDTERAIRQLEELREETSRVRLLQGQIEQF
jgi:hypothetical protein